MDECREAFEELKGCLGAPPLLSKPHVEETLYMYLITSMEAVSSVLVSEDEKGCKS